jgi:hypothetical protein
MGVRVSNIEPPRFQVGQEVLVDQGLPGEVTAVRRGTVPGALGLPPLDTWLYTVEPEADGEPQTNVPEYNVVTRESLGWFLPEWPDRNSPNSTTATGSTATGIRTPVSGLRIGSFRTRTSDTARVGHCLCFVRPT